MKRLLTLVLSAVVVGAAFAPAPAQAKPHAGAMQCFLSISSWPGWGEGSCTGTFYGVDADGPDVSCVTGCPLLMDVDSWQSTCSPLGEPALIDTGSGQLFIGEEGVGSFFLLKVGVAILIVPSNTAGVGGLVPIFTGPIPTCEFTYSGLNAVMAASLATL